jgi:hypothetical protein
MIHRTRFLIEKPAGFLKTLKEIWKDRMVKEVVKKFLFILKPGYKSKKFYV